MWTNFRYQSFVTASENLGVKVPIVEDVLLSQEQQFYPTTSPDENCKEFEFQTDWYYNVDLRQTYFGLKLNFNKGRVDEGTAAAKNEQRLRFFSLLVNNLFTLTFFP